MNKLGLFNLTFKEIIPLILIAFAAALIFAVIWQHTNNASNWQDYYAKELVRIIDSSKPGDNVSMDVQKGTEIAKTSGLDLLNDKLFDFNSMNHEVCVKLGKGSPTCYSYFNDVTILTSAQPIEFGMPTNTLHFNLVAPSTQMQLVQK